MISGNCQYHAEHARRERIKEANWQFEESGIGKDFRDET